SAQIREILINESAWEEMTCLFALSLAKSGISFVKRRDGRPRVTWTHVNAALFGDRKIVADEEEKPNFDAI
uniref:DUF4224 domain-containing protein n=1 Tax=Klebsiella pneumoniae TaxID=573 RepID=UPI003D16F310